MAFQDPADQSAGENPKRTSFNRDICAGLFLIAGAAFGFYAAYPLDSGSMSGVGSGLMPKAVALGSGAFGLYLVAAGLRGSEERVESFSLRGTIFILGAILAFAATVRPYGLLVAGPLAMLISSMADPDTRPLEIVIYTTCMTAACFLLFKVFLRLPIPAMPLLLGY